MARFDKARWTAGSAEEAAAVLGISSRQFKSYLPRGCPGSPKNYPMSDIIAWCKEHVWKAKPGLVLTGEDAALAEGVDSPSLERWRAARADMAELDLHQRQQELVALSDVHELFVLTAQVYRDAGDQLVRQFGNAAGDIIAQALEAAERHAERRWGGLETDKESP